MALEIRYPHKNRLDTLKTDKKIIDKETIAKCETEYILFVNDFTSAVNNKNHYDQIEILKTYRAFAKEMEQKYSFIGTGTKYYSSILEEIPIHICEPIVKSGINELNLNNFKLYLGGGMNCTIRMAANPDGSISYEKKQIDFSLSVLSDTIGKKEIIVPLVGLEVKKYLDKTMFGTILETYKSLQIFRPRTYYGFVVEDEARASDVILNSIMYNNEFVLTDAKRQKKTDDTLNPIDTDSYINFVGEFEKAIKKALNSLSMK